MHYINTASVGAIIALKPDIIEFNLPQKLSGLQICLHLVYARPMCYCHMNNNSNEIIYVFTF